MSKRKSKQSPSEDSSSDVSLVDVDFEFFDPNPSVDYHALKRLLAQLYQSDSELFHLQDLTELILAQPLVGSTVKTDGIESDPFAFLTVLNMHVHQNHPSVKALIAYHLLKSDSSMPFHATLQGLLGPTGLKSDNHVGFVIGERLINMPVQIVPHMYRMLADEIKWANEDNEPYNFTHFLFISRTYRLTPSQESELAQSSPRATKRLKGAPQITQRNATEGEGGVYSFHPEDEYIMKVASHTLDYTFTSSQPREEDSFGLDMGGRMMLVPAERFGELVGMLSEALGAVPDKGGSSS